MKIMLEASTTAKNWQLAEDESDISEGSWFVLVDYWLRHQTLLKPLSSSLALRITNLDELNSVAANIQQFSRVEIFFEKFNNGVAYSLARLLRKRYKYQNQLVAVGDIRIEQLELIRRCGFDEYVLAEGQNAEIAAEKQQVFTHSQQPFQENQTWVGEKRFG